MSKRKSHLVELLDLQEKLDAARHAVAICAYALDHGNTDLELQSSEVPRKASEELDEVTDMMSSIRLDAKVGFSKSMRRQLKEAGQP